MLPDRFSAFIRWWVNTSSRSSAYSSKDMSEASMGAGFAAAAATRRWRLYVYHTWRPSIARRCSTLRFWSRGPATQKQHESYKVLHLPRKSNLTILKSWPCHAKTTWKLQSTAPATKIQPYDSEVVALPRENNLKVTKYCTCHKNPTLRFWSRGPATRKQPESHKVLHLPQKSNLTVTLAEKTQEKMQIIRLETRKK